jgi:hypothetical protein
MSDTAQNSDWWLASDGKWYPPSSQPGSPLPPPPSLPNAKGKIAHAHHRAPLNVVFAGWTQALLWATAGVCSVIAVLALWYRQAMNSWFQDNGTLDDAISAEEVFMSWTEFFPLVLAATFILLIIWLAKAHGATTALLGVEGERKYSRGWSIGAWFVPIANLFVTPQIFAETQRIADAPRVDGRIWGSWRTVRIRSELVWWWILFVGGMIMFRIGLTLSINDDAAIDKMIANRSLDDYLYGLLLAAVGAGLAAGGAICGAIFIRHVSRRLADGMI